MERLHTEYLINRFTIDFLKKSIRFEITPELSVYDSEYSQKRRIMNEKLEFTIPLIVLHKQENLENIRELILKYATYELEEMIKGIHYY